MSASKTVVTCGAVCSRLSTMRSAMRLRADECGARANLAIWASAMAAAGVGAPVDLRNVREHVVDGDAPACPAAANRGRLETVLLAAGAAPPDSLRRRRAQRRAPSAAAVTALTARRAGSADGAHAFVALLPSQTSAGAHARSHSWRRPARRRRRPSRCGQHSPGAISSCSCFSDLVAARRLAGAGISIVTLSVSTSISGSFSPRRRRRRP